MTPTPRGRNGWTLRNPLQRRPKAVLLTILLLTAVGALLASYVNRVAHPWGSSLLLDVSVTAGGFFVAVFVVDWLVARHESLEGQRRWEQVSADIGFYARRVANQCAFAYRVAEGVGDPSVPGDDLRANEIGGMVAWIEKGLVPGLPKMRRLTPDGWKLLATNLTDADEAAREVLLLFGDRLKPSVFEALVQLRRSLFRALLSLDNYAPVLGVPVSAMRIEPTMRVYDLVEFAQQKYPEKSRVETYAKIRESVEGGAISEGREVLTAATALLGATMALMPPEPSRG